MDLADLPELLPDSKPNRPLSGPISGLAYNSKTMKNGELFFCLRGFRADGHRYAPEAVANGAIALVVEEFLPLDVAQILVPNARAALSTVGRHLYGDPAARLGLIGVTGTNGKTTTTFMIRSVLEEAAAPVGLIGTVYNQLGGAPEPSDMTTPESAQLWRMFDQALTQGCRWVVMEVSSHATAMGRVEPADFDIAVVLNITRDHFEFHGTFEHYWASKARLVKELRPERKGGRPKGAVLNADDPQVMAMARGVDLPIITFGMQDTSDIYPSEVKVSVTGSQFLLHLPGVSPLQVRLPLPGAFNVSNALAAAAVGWMAGVSPAGIVRGLQSCRHVPGRAEAIDEGQDFHVLVDFAHNPDALAKVVSLRPERPGARTILVFGAEGGKDQGKRPQMGEAARGADLVIITSDNMHKEEPADVARQIASGLQGHPYEVILDRRQAIERALHEARTGDLVIIAGKGHESTWVFEGQRIAFDDRAVAREILRELLSHHRITPL